MTIGYHIDPVAHTIEPVSYTLNGRELNRILACQTVGAGEVLGNNVTMVDDDGLSKPCRHFWRLVGSEQPQPHGAVLVGPDKYAKRTGKVTMQDPTIKIEVLRDLVEWVDRKGFEAWIDANFDKPAVSVNGVTLQTWGSLYEEMPVE